MGATIVILADDASVEEDSSANRVLLRDKIHRTIAELEPNDIDVCVCDGGELTPEISALSRQLPIEVVMWPNAHSPLAYGSAVSCLAGASWAIGTPGRTPLDLPDDTGSYFLGVVLAGIVAADAIGGQPGVKVHHATRMLEGFVEQNVAPYNAYGIPWERAGRRASRCCGMYPYGIYDCSDGQVAIIGRSNLHWAELAKELGIASVADRYPDAVAIVAENLIDEVDRELQDALSARSRSNLAALAESTGILLAPVMTLGEVLEYVDPMVERNYWNHDPEFGKTPGLPFVASS